VVCCIAAGFVFAFFVGLFRKLRGRGDDAPESAPPPPTPRVEVTPAADESNGRGSDHADERAPVGSRG